MCKTIIGKNLSNRFIFKILKEILILNIRKLKLIK